MKHAFHYAVASPLAAPHTRTLCTPRGRKGTSFLLCASLNAWQKLVTFFTYIKECISYNSVYLI